MALTQIMQETVRSLPPVVVWKDDGWSAAAASHWRNLYKTAQSHFSVTVQRCYSWEIAEKISMKLFENTPYIETLKPINI